MSNLSKSVNVLSTNLLKVLSDEKKGENVFFSALSISTCMSMVLIGAEKETKSQLIKALALEHVQGVDKVAIDDEFHKALKELGEKTYTLYLKNRVLLHSDFKVEDAYKKKLESSYSAQLDEVDFVKNGSAIMNTVNQWVSSSTEGMIKTLLDEPPSPASRLILLNAIYFKGKWIYPFDPHHTHKAEFYNHGTTKKDGVDFMSRSDFDVDCTVFDFKGDKIQLLELPYNGDASMFFLLPEKHGRLNDILAAITVDNIEAAIKTTKVVTSDIIIPKFRFETEYHMNDSLAKLGASHLFDPSKADLTGIRKGRDIFVSKVTHKAVVDVDEEGTRAAAVTSATAMLMCMRYNFVFRANHPFLFFIRDKKSAMILFMGRVEKF